MRLVFAGTPAAAVPTLRRLAASHDIAAVVTRPDAPLGRRRVLTASPVAQAAEELGLEPGRRVLASIVSWNVIAVEGGYRRATSGPLVIETAPPALVAAALTGLLLIPLLRGIRV